MFFRALLLAASMVGAAPVLAQTPPQPSAWLYQGSDIAPDPAWRFGSLPNGLRYAVRRNALPAGQVSIRVRVDVGALHEEADQQGWAHFTEHMLFRGTASFADREARNTWQTLGASFGSDTNASTSPTQTVYQLDLPKNDRQSLDTSLHVLSEMMTSALFDPATVEAERRIVSAEKARRPEVSQRVLEGSRAIFYPGLRIADRDTAGTAETLAAATPQGLRAFYQRWYRPERTTIVMVGDADPAEMEALLRARFGGWQGHGPAPQAPDFGRPAEAPQPVLNVAYPGVPETATAMWLRPYQARPHTMARERESLVELLAERIVNRRLEAEARQAGSAYISAGLDQSRSRAVAESTSLSVVTPDGRWNEGLNRAFAILGDALRAPPSQAEISREIQNLRTSATAAVTGESTVLSQNRANQLINALDNDSVVATAATVLENFERNAAGMTPDVVHAAMRRMVDGAGPRLMLISPQPVAQTALVQGLAAARAVAPAERRAERQVRFEDLPALGSPGREVSRQRIEDMDVTIVRFANGSTLTHKRTTFEQGTVHVRARFGTGMAGVPIDRPSLAWLSGLIGPSGVANLDLDAVERLLTGRRMMMGFAMAEDAMVLSGQTNAADLPDQMRLLATKMAHPRWDAALFARFQSAALESFAMHDSSASARASREMPGVVRPGDVRYRPVERAQIAAARLPAMQSYFTPLLAQGPVNVIVVGDVTLDAAVAAMRGTIAALPQRTGGADRSASLQPPAPNPEPRRFTHKGDPNQAYALIGWSTFGGVERAKERRALSIAANILRVRLFDRIREAEGVSYSPSASHSASETFGNWGVMTAATELRSEHIPTFFRIAREVVADLAANPVGADEFARAINPAISGVERQLATNGYWVGALENWADDPREIANVRSLAADIRSLTPEDIRRAVATHVADAGDWSMVVVAEPRGAAAE